MRSWLIPLKEDKRLVNRIEGALAKHIASRPSPIGAYQDPEVRYYLRDESEQPLKFAFDPLPPILGFPSAIEARHVNHVGA